MSTSSLPRSSSRPTMYPSRRAISSKSRTAYPRRERTSQVDDLPVPGVPVIAMITATRIRRSLKSLRPRLGPDSSRGRFELKAGAHDLSEDGPDQVQGKRQREDEDGVMGHEERHCARLEEVEPREGRR